MRDPRSPAAVRSVEGRRIRAIHRVVAGTFAAGLLAACGTTVEPPEPPAVDPAISIALDRSTITMSAGEAAQPIRVALVRAGNATGAVDLSIAGLPSGVRASITPAQLTGTATSAVIDLTATAAAPAATATATVRATSGSLSSQATVAVTVRRQEHRS